jgi:nucleoside-diphosphate-sugar epimerase
VTILVTGGRGLVGSHVIQQLRTIGESVRSFEGDVTDAAAWRRAATGGGGISAIFHAAAKVAQHLPYAEFERINVGGTRLAIETAQTTGARLVHMSSASVYGRAAGYDARSGAVAEDSLVQPISEHDFYARTKRLSEELVRDSGLPAVAIRSNVIYGEGDRLFTPRVIAAVRRGVFPVIGSGKNHLSCVYVGNVASAIVAALKHPVSRFRVYNVTHDAPPALTQREFVTSFVEALGVRLLRFPVPTFVARLGAQAWAGWQRFRNPSAYAGLGGAAVSFIVGENPYSDALVQQELKWTPPFDTRTAIRRAVADFASRGVTSRRS